MNEAPASFAVLWDLDATLVDTTNLHYLAWAKTLAPYGIPFDYQIFLSTFGRNNQDAINLLFDHPSPDFIQQVSDRKEVMFRELAHQGLNLVEGVEEWLKRFRAWGFRQAIASSAPEENVQALVDDAGIRHYFDVLQSGSSLPSKPAPAIFLVTAEKLGIPPRRCLVIEDAPAGIAAARSAGMLSLAVETTHTPSDLYQADRIIRRLSDFSVDDMQLFLGLIE